MLIKTENNQLTFTDGRFYFDTDGAFYPSVTTCLEAYPKPPQFYQWLKEQGENADKVRDAAGRRGSIVHELSEHYDNGLEVNLIAENGYPKYSLQEWGMFEKYVEFANSHTIVNHLIEQNIVSGVLGYAGTIDRVCSIDGKEYILDIKTSNGVYNSYWLQLAAYRELLRTINKEVDGVAILWLNAKTRTVKDGQGVGWQLITKEDTAHDLRLFDATKMLWLEEHSSDKPKEFSYQMSYKK